MLTKEQILEVEESDGSRNLALRRKYNKQMINAGGKHNKKKLRAGQIEDNLDKLTSKVNDLLKQPLHKMLLDIEEVKTLIEKVKTDVQKLKEQVKSKNEKQAMSSSSKRSQSSSSNSRKRQKAEEANSFCEKIKDPALLPFCEMSKWLLDEIHLLSDEEIRKPLEILYIRPLAMGELKFWAFEMNGQTVQDLLRPYPIQTDFGSKVLIPLIENITDFQTRNRFDAFIKNLKDKIEKKKYLKKHGRPKPKFNKGDNAIYTARGRYWKIRTPYPGENCIIAEREYNERQKKWFYDIKLTAMSAYTRQHFPNDKTLKVPEDSLTT